MMKCGFCGLNFSEAMAKPGCEGCPMGGTCGKIKCPRCGFEMVKEPNWFRYFKKKWGGKHG